MRSLGGLAGIVAGLVVWLAPQAALAYPCGIPRSSLGSSGCAGCHGGGTGTTGGTVSFSPTTPTVGQTVTVTVTVTHGSLSHGGFNLTLDGGTFPASPGTNASRVSTTEVMHSTPTSGRTWSLTWTAPSSAGSYAWTLWANAVNNNWDGTCEPDGPGATGDTPAASLLMGSVNVRLAQGAVCSTNDQCLGNRCVDGRCCNSLCNLTCQACSIAAGGTTNGTCTALRADAPTASECCSSGFRWNGSSCVEVDECAEANDCCQAGVGGCVVTAECANLTGSYSCDCPPGYAGDGFTSGSRCTPCPPGTTTVGDDQFCSNIDECLTASCGNGACAEIPLASWVAPGFVCNCDMGYEQADTPGGRTCVDVDECARGLDDCTPPPAGLCTNTIGGFECSCQTPAFVGTTGRDCVDYDECEDPVYYSRCSSVATCINGFGTWECRCNDGYEGDGETCVDIDECERMLDECHLEASCTNTNGSYNCSCNEGYEGNGFFCRDTDECASGAHGCALNELCVNQIGAPNLCVCATGFTRETEDGPCLVRCGDGARGQGEACDDGNVSAGDGCDPDCAIERGWACREPRTGGTSACEETCGDGLIDTFEECDDGDANSDTAPNACRTTCVAAHCGDGIQDDGETCDDGDANTDTAPNACRTSCDRAYCGDGVIDTGELCDPGGGTPEAAVAGQCTTLCRSDAGIDPSDPPQLTGGACGCRAAPAPRGCWLGLAAAALAALSLRRRRR